MKIYLIVYLFMPNLCPCPINKALQSIPDFKSKRLLFHELSGSALFMDVPRLYS